MRINVLHLYPDYMNLYGEYGNVKILEKHLKDQGYEVIVDRKTRHEKIDFTKPDIIYMGSGTEKNQKVVLEDLKNYKEDIVKYIESGKVFLATGNSYEIFGKEINTKEEKIEGLNILDFKVTELDDRVTGDVIMKAKGMKEEIVGFINKMSYIEGNKNKLFNVEFGIGEDKANKIDGVKYNNFYGTHVIGPILSRNPEFLENLVTLVCSSVDSNFKIRKVSYENEEKGHELVVEELTKRMEQENK